MGRECQLEFGLIYIASQIYICIAGHNMCTAKYQNNVNLIKACFDEVTLKALVTSVIPSPGYIKSTEVLHCNF